MLSCVYVLLSFPLVIFACFVLEYINFEKLRQCSTDYAFHGYGEVCNFIYCLLMRTRKLSDLPGIHEWESYMDVSKLSSFGVISMKDFLMDCDFGSGLAAIKTRVMQEFRVKCRECLDRFVFLVLEHVTVTSGISRGLYCFCPENMLEGDDQHVFELFDSLCELFGSCNVLSADDLKAAAVEYKSYVVEKRRHHKDSTYVASEIRDVMQFLLRDFGFQSRTHVFRLFKICCLLVGTQDSNPPVVTIDLSGSSLDRSLVQECILVVQSHVLGPSFNPQLFFSGSLLLAVQNAIANSGEFFVGAGVDVWEGLRFGDVSAFVGRYRPLYRNYLAERRKSCEAYYMECNKANRSARDSQISSAAETGSGTSSVGSSKKLKVVDSKTISRDVCVAGSSSTNIVKSCGSSKRDCIGSTKPAIDCLSGRGTQDSSKGKKKKAASKENDSDVVHKLKKGANN